MLYLHRDYQGSIIAITNDTGAIVEKRQFDAWGAILKVQDGANNVLNGLTILDRGYTGHEHLQGIGLINMNGRLYDPKLHRFLQPDNYVQDASNTQNYNRYSYVLNNPLKYTDPSGEKWKITWSDIVSAVAIVAGTVLTFTGFPMIGVPLIGAGVAHFTTALNEFKQTGDWVSASNNAGFIVSFTVKTDFGYDSDNKPNGITQTEPVVKPIAADDVRNMGSGNNSAQQQARDRANGIYLLYRTNYDDFFGNKIMINSENGSNNWSFLGTIHTSKRFYDGYKRDGLNSYSGLLLMHEYGHWLHSQYNSLNWYSYGMWSSMATANSANASSNWTEIKSNTMAYYYFGLPTIFNNPIYKKEYPIDKNSISDELKYKLYHHLKP